jgi:hypothetical protein
MIVHMMAVPPTHDAITMSTVKVVRVILDDDAVGAAEALAEASDACVVTVTWALVGVGVVTKGVVAAAMDVRSAVDEDELDSGDGGLESVDEGELELEPEPVFVDELTTLLRPDGPLVEDDEEEDGGAGAELDVVGIFLEDVGVSDGVGADCTDVLDAADVVLTSVGGSAPAPTAGPAFLLPLSSKSPPPSCG